MAIIINKMISLSFSLMLLALIDTSGFHFQKMTCTLRFQA
jgi:hypothetical protein